ncbi:MAG: hypothetical protein EXR60_00250 [Dehalococcoidia bacterium]|nr:hypothetical protein [Dehalococcoidia bacterium]
MEDLEFGLLLFRVDLLQALRSRDLDRLRACLVRQHPYVQCAPGQFRRLLNDDLYLQAAIYERIVAEPLLEALHPEAQAWLEVHGFEPAPASRSEAVGAAA